MRNAASATLVFTGGFIMMVLEIIDARLLAKDFGSSFHVWVSQIGVVLIALAVGYYVGGALADRWQRLWVLALLLAPAGLLTCLLPNIAASLLGLRRFDYGLGLSVRPAFVTNVRNPGPAQDTDFDADVALDVIQKVTSNLLAALTVNTDFAETEVDVRQINLTRFELFFPEKRSFFLEGSDIFEFGAGLDEESLVPFNSRRIGLLGLTEEEQSEVPINVGGKINGRLGVSRPNGFARLVASL